MPTLPKIIQVGVGIVAQHKQTRCQGLVVPGAFLKKKGERMLKKASSNIMIALFAQITFYIIV